jgi:hypothetical protein
MELLNIHRETVSMYFLNIKDTLTVNKKRLSPSKEIGDSFILMFVDIQFVLLN